jgi:hypothetical protein
MEVTTISQADNPHSCHSNADYIVPSPIERLSKKERISGDRKRVGYTNFQVLTAIKTHPGCNLYELLDICQTDYSRWMWTIGKVQRSVNTLEQAGQIKSDTFISGGRACRQLYAK